MIKKRRLSNVFCHKVDKLSIEEVEELIIDLWDEMDSNNDIKIRYCLDHRAQMLNDQFNHTPQEIEQFRHVAEMLIKQTEILYRNVTKIYRELCAKYDAGECGDFPIFNVEAILEIDNLAEFFEKLNSGEESDYDKFGEILGDIYFGDFGKLCSVSLFYNESDEPIEKYIDCIFGCHITDGKVDTTWDCGSLYSKYPILNGIPVCYALHHLTTHIAYSIQDIIRITNFRREVKVSYSDNATIGIK